MNFLAFLKFWAKDHPTMYGQTIYHTAASLLGRDASPEDLASDEFGCAETVCDVLAKAGFGTPRIYLSTTELYAFLKENSAWAPVGTPLAGDVIISPTDYKGSGRNGVTHGHTGIVMDSGTIASNNSFTGTFDINYTFDSWNRRWKVKGGYPVLLYRRIS